MDASDLSKLAALIASHSTFCHVTHVNPDADGFGSALAMSRHLRRLGKESHVVLAAPLPKRLAWLVREGEARVASDPQSLPPDAVFFLYDFSALRRLGSLEPAVAGDGRTRVVFDHHDGHIDFECLSFFDENAAATAQIIADVFEAWNVPLDLDLAVPLYAGLIADSGSFNYGKTTSHTHAVAGRLLDAGVDPLEVHGIVEGSNDIGSLRLAAQAMTTLQKDVRDPRIAHLTLALALWSEAGDDILDTVDLVNQTIGIEGVRAGALLIHTGPNVTRLSLRSKGSTSIVEVAKSFGGGGHRNAAGATLAGAPDDVREQVLERLRASVLAQHGPSVP